MAEVKVIEVQIKSNIDGATTSVSKFKAGLKDATTQSKELGSTLQGSKQSEFIDKLGDGVGKLNPAFGAAVKGANGLIVKMWAMAANPVGAVLAAIVVTAKFLYEAFQDSIEGGKELKAAFAALSAIGATVKSAMFELGRSLINVTSAAYKFITLDFKGAAEDMKKAGQEATNAQKHLGDAVDGTTAKVIQSLTKRQQANDKAAKMQAVTQANTDKLLVKSREILMDEDASMAAKKKALAEVTAAENASAKEKLRIAQENLNIKKSEQKLYGETSNMGKKMNQELRDLTIERDHAEQENYQTAFKLGKQRRTLGKQEVADKKENAAEQKSITEAQTAAAKVAYDADKTALEEKLREEGLTFSQRRELIKSDLILKDEDRKKLNAQIDKEEKKSIEDHNKAIADLNKKYDDEKLNRLADTAVKKEELDYNRQVAEIEKLAQTELEKQTLIEKLDGEHKVRMGIAQKTDSDKIAADAKANSDAKKKIAELEKKDKLDAVDATASSLSAISELLGKETAAGKAAAVASATINTFSSAQKAYDATVGIPYVGPFLAPINAGIAIAAGIKNVKSILAVKTPGGGGSAPSMSGSGGGSASAAAAPAFNVVGASPTNQLAQTIGNQQQQPIKAFVVANDVTTQQSLDRNIVSSASIG
jgi:hypothetical protein